MRARRESVVEHRHQEVGAAAGHDHHETGDRRRPQDVEAEEVEVARRHQIADEALDVVAQAGDGRHQPQHGAGDEEHHEHAQVEDDGELEHRPRIDPTDHHRRVRAARAECRVAGHAGVVV